MYLCTEYVSVKSTKCELENLRANSEDSLFNSINCRIVCYRNTNAHWQRLISLMNTLLTAVMRAYGY